MSSLPQKEPNSEQDIQALWKRFAQYREQSVKNEILVHYVHLIKGIVYRMMPTYQGISDYDDLISCGVLGLMDAIDKFDIHREIKFETYAAKRIRGEIIDHMRKQDWAPSSLRRKINRVTQTYNMLESQLCRPVSETEVANYLQMDITELQKILSKTHAFNLLYFEDFLYESYVESEMVLNDDYLPVNHIEKKELKEILGNMIDALPQNEKTVVTLYYFEELTLKEIASVLKVSESRVSQIHSKVLAKLKSKLQHLLAN